MVRETFPVGLLQCNCTILGDETTLEAIVVDPGAELQKIMAVIAKHGFTVKQILVTHAHIDHIAGALELKFLTGAPIAYSQHDLPLVAMMNVQAGWLNMPTPEVRPPDEDLRDGLVVEVGAMRAEVIHTPGHTPGSVCLYLPAHTLLLAGDTLFAGSVGRSDLPGGDGARLIRSIRDRLLPLSDATSVIPGHGRPTTIGDERTDNPFLAV